MCINLAEIRNSNQSSQNFKNCLFFLWETNNQSLFYREKGALSKFSECIINTVKKREDFNNRALSYQNIQLHEISRESYWFNWQNSPSKTGNIPFPIFQAQNISSRSRIWIGPVKEESDNGPF